MVSEALIEKISSIKSGQDCFLNFKVGSEEHRLDCQLVSITGDLIQLDITFLQKFALKAGEGVSFSTAPSLVMPTISCETIVVSHNNNDIQLKVMGEIDPATFRNNFRVNIRVPVQLEFNQSRPEEDGYNWSTTGETIDLSRSGLLAILATEAPTTEDLTLSIELPDPVGTAKCFAEIVRIKRLTKKRWLTAIHFKAIEEKDSDLILSNCLQEQRRQIRENVQL